MAGTPRKRKKVGAGFEDRSNKKMAEGPWKAAERILGRWRIGGTEPYMVCEEDEEEMGSRNLRLLDSALRHMQSGAPGSTVLTPEKDVLHAE